MKTATFPERKAAAHIINPTPGGYVLASALECNMP